MPPGPGGGGGWGGGDPGGGRRKHPARKRQGNEEIRKFLNFYKRRNSLCVDLYLPAFFQRKPSYDDLADFVYSVMSVGGPSPPHLVRAAVLDIQLHPVKKLFFVKFTDQLIRDQVVAKLQAGLNWPAFDTTVSGWSMDRPMERIRVLGTSPETDEVELRKILGQYGEVLEAQKGLISKKLPGCTNGIWTVKMFVSEGKSLPPFLIMKDDGEVWQLATGESSVCWKCGQAGHIGDKCRQAVNVLAESLASPAVGVQPSWAHVVKGGVSVVPTPPPLPPRPQVQQLISVQLSSFILKNAKASLKIVGSPTGASSVAALGKVMEFQEVFTEEAQEHSFAQAESRANNAFDTSVEDEINKEEIDNTPSKFCPLKKAKLSSNQDVSKVSGQLSTSPVLHHKVPSSRQLLGAIGEGQDGGEDTDSEDDNVEGGNGEGMQHTNMFGVNFVMWFDISIDGKDSMDPKEDDWGGRLEFGYNDKAFPKDFEDYFLMFEDECTTQSHACAGRVRSVLFDKRDKVLQPPKYDPRNIVALIDKYKDAHILDSGWREVDTEEWMA